MVHQATLEYTEPLVRRAAFVYWRRTINGGFWAVLAMLACVLAVFVWSGDRSWVVGVLASVLVVGAFLVILLYAFNLRVLLAKVRAMDPRTSELTVDESFFRMASSIASGSLAWSTFTEVWRFPDFWLLLVSPAEFIVFPLKHVSDEAQQFILDRISATGGKIVN